MGHGSVRYLYLVAILIALASQIVQFFTGFQAWVNVVWGLVGVLWVLAGVGVASVERQLERWVYLTSALVGLLALGAGLTSLLLSSVSWAVLSVAVFLAALSISAVHHGWQHWLYLGPAVTILGIILVYPTVVTFIVSLFDDFYQTSRSFVGLGKYVEVLTSREGWIAIRNTAIWIVLMTTSTVGIGLILAVLLDRVRYESIAKSIIFMPMAISFTAASIIWRFVYAYKPASIPQIGVLNGLMINLGEFASQPVVSGVLNGLWFVFGIPALALWLAAITRKIGDGIREWSDERRINSAWITLIVGVIVLAVSYALTGFLGQLLWIAGILLLLVPAFTDRTLGPPLVGLLVLFGIVDFLLSIQGIGPTPWYTSRNGITNTIAIVVEGIWVWTGFAMVVLSAAYKGIPPQMKEAARIDGANEWQVFWHITIPFMKSTIAVVTTAILVFVLKIFDFVWVTTGGNFNTHVLASLMVEETGNFNRGRAAVYAMLIMLLVIPILWANVKQFREQEEVR